MERKAYPEFYRQIFKLLIPIVIQNMLNAAVSSADVLMLSFVGQSAISAVSLASNYAGVLFSINFGLGTGVTMLTAQYYGKGDLRAIRAVEGIALRLGLVFSLVFGGAALLIPRWMMLLFTNDGELIELGCQYLRIVSLAYICWGITEIYTAVLRSMGRATICMVRRAEAGHSRCGHGNGYLCPRRSGGLSADFHESPGKTEPQVFAGSKQSIEPGFSAFGAPGSGK